MDYYWPRDIIPNEQTWSVVGNTGVFPSSLSGVTRTVSRPGMRLGCSLSLPPMKGANRARMSALIQALKGRSNRIWLFDIASPLRGSFPSPELIGNNTFPDVSGWASSNGELVLTPDSGRMRLSRTSVAADRYASYQTTTVSGSSYLFRCGVLPGRSAPNYNLQIATTSTGTDLHNGTQYTAGGYRHGVGTASGTTTHAIVRDRIASRAANDFQFLDAPSFARCALVNGASQTGSGLWIDGLPASTLGLAYAGDMVAIYTTTWEMKRLIADLNSNSSGQGQILFEPGCRSSPADNAPVAFSSPMARFLLASDDVAYRTTPGLFSDFQLDFIEDVT